jgi:hypothetical protein
MSANVAVDGRWVVGTRPREPLSTMDSTREESMREIDGGGNVRFDRRAVFAAAASLIIFAGGGLPRADDTAPLGGPLSDVPLVLPKTEFVYEAIFDLEPTLNLGEGPLGERHMIPIAGGVFAGPRINGAVLAGGADRQLVRKDGARMLNALYELKTDDGAIITVNNRVLIDKRADGSRYAFSQLDVSAPEGPYDWLNHLVLVGTLHSLAPKPQVLIRVHSLT